MSDAQKTKKLAWKSDSVEGAFLFLLFHKRICGHPDNFSAAEIQQNLLWGFDRYSANTFKRSCQTIANRVKKFEEKGSGLSKQFKELISEALKKHAEHFEQGDTDEEYVDEGEEDLSHVSKAKDEESLSDPLQDPRFRKANNKEQPPVDKVNILPTSRRSQTNNKKQQTKMPEKAKESPACATAAKNPFAYLEGYSDGRLIGVLQLSSGWDGTFVISEDCKSVIKRTKLPPALFNARIVLQRHGLDNNNIHMVSLQSAMKDKAKKLVAQAKQQGQDVRRMQDVYYDEVVWKLPFEVRPKFCDHQGKESNDIFIESDSSGVEWAYMFMVGVHAKEVEEPQAPRVVRNRNRQR